MTAKSRPAARRSNTQGQQRNQPPRTDPKDRAEWVIAAIAAYAVLFVFGFLAYEAVTRTGQSPVLTVRAGELTSVAGDSYLEIEVTNSGHRAAADLEIEGKAAAASGAPKSGHVTLDYAPAESEVSGTIVFDGVVDPDTIDVQITGFRVP